MPYNYSNPPDTVKNLPAGAQHLFIDAFNSVYADTGNEETARFAGWAKVKTQYKKQGEQWVEKSKEEKAMADETRLHYVAVIGDMDERRLVDAVPQLSTIQIFRTGTFYHPNYGKFTITPDTLAQMVNNFKAHRPKAPTEMVIDYEHMSISEPPQVAPAAGWFKGLELRRDGNELWASVEWTSEAAKKIVDKEYRFISPEFSLNYKDKESGKPVGPTLFAAALTNRPFIEGMEPVVLSEELAAMLFSEVIPAKDWDTAYIDDLPDSCFAYIAPGGEKDANGKTVPRSNRSLPYKNAQGNIDLPHLRNALSRLPQTDLSPEAQAKARAALDKAAEEAGLGEQKQAAENKSKEVTLEDKVLRELLGVDDKADLAATIKALKGKATTDDATIKQLTDAKAAVEKTATDVQAKLDGADADAAVAKALTDRKILPSQTGYFKAMYLKDKKQFTDYLATVTTPIGPDMTIKGKETPATPPAGEAPGADPTEAELKIAKEMGVSEQALREQKARDAKLEKASK